MTVSRSSARALFTALCLALVVPALPACNEAQRANREYRQKERQRRKAMDKVQERTEAYLLAVRWRDFQAAAAFHEDVADRVAYLQRMTDPAARHPTIESFTIDFVLVDDELKGAEVRVTLAEVNADTMSLGSRDETLLWYHSERAAPKGWYLVPVTVVEPD